MLGFRGMRVCSKSSGVGVEEDVLCSAEAEAGQGSHEVLAIWTRVLADRSADGVVAGECHLEHREDGVVVVM